MLKMNRYVSSILCGLLLVGCATVGSGKPDWVMMGGGAFKNDPTKLYGVGIAEGINSEALRITTADNRALAEVSKQLSTVSTSLMKDYMSSTSSVEQDQASGEQYIENTVKTFTSNTVTGVKIIDRWDNGKVTYSLAILDVNDLKMLTEELPELTTEVKEYIKANADKAFADLNAEQANIQ